MRKLLAVLTIILIINNISYGQNQIDKRKDIIETKIDSLLAIMTIEEKIGQMNQYNGFWEATGSVPEEGNEKLKYDHLKQGYVGSMLNVSGVENVRKIQEIAVNETRLGIPLIFGLDVIHGYRTVFPIPLAESASWDLEAIKTSARSAAIESSARGINWTFAPMIDISRDARWGRVMEGAGEDTYLGSKIGVARIKGFQGDDLSKSNTIAATAKHFAAYGFVESGKEYNSADLGTSTLYNVILPPFKAAVDNDVKTVMNSFNTLNGIPATGDEFLQREILKGKWGFNGFVISDWGSIGEMREHGYAKDLKHAAKLAANAGSDMDMESYAYVQFLKELVESGDVDVKKIDDAARRILRVKYELGLFDDPYKYCDEEREKKYNYSAEHMAYALDMAKKSIVLLKNDKQLLPLKKKQKSIAIIGTLANDKNSPLGNWRPGSDDDSAVSLVEGIKKYTSNTKYAEGVELVIGETGFTQELKINNTDRSGFDEAIKLAKESKVVIMVLGEYALHSGEGRSRANLGLPGLQQELLEEVYKVNKNIVLVLMNGRPLAIPWAAENIPAIVEGWHLGSTSGDAIAQVLFGDYNPSGKLTMTFPRSVGQVPIYYNYLNTGRPGPKEIVFWSHYIDEKNTPVYPFGYGLSYTSFKYDDLKIDDSDKGEIKVSVTVKNIGKYDGEEVVQLYIRDKFASVVRPVKELKGFEKISLKKGESRVVKFTLTEKELGFYNNKGKFILEEGEFEVMVGTNSQELLKGSFEL